MRRILPLLWVLLLAVPKQSFAQNYCAFDSLRQMEQAADPMTIWRHKAHIGTVNEFRQGSPFNLNVVPNGIIPSGPGGSGCKKAIFIVPVVIHIIHDPANPASNLHDSVVEKQIEILNKAFANEIDPGNPLGVDTRIQFCLAKRDQFGGSITGIDHIPDANPVYSLQNDSQQRHLASLTYYDPDRYLNIWVVNDIPGASGYASSAYTSGIDGVVMKYNVFGDYTWCSTCGFANTSRGLILAHEVGHYLGLFHPFQDDCAGTDSATCAWEGDFCCDTRPTKRSDNCPVPSFNQCPGLADYGVYPDNYENMMAYADDACRNNFTPDQVSVMHSVLSNAKRSLVTTDNINVLDLSCCAIGAWFNVENGTLCSADTVRFRAIDHSGAVSYRWKVYNSTKQVLDTTLSASSFGWVLQDTGKYHVKIYVITTTDSITLVRENMIELRNCGNRLASTQGNWYFGKYSGINFRAVGPVLDLSAFNARPHKTINTGEGAVTQSDKNGNLLFYAGGDSVGLNVFRLYRLDTVLVNNHTQVNQSTPILGHTSSSQGGVVIPFKHDSTRFHLFTTTSNDDTDPGCYRSVLDIDNPDLLVSGFRNLNLPVPLGSEANSDGTIRSSEMLTAIPTCDGNHWLITSDWSGTGYANRYNLLVYLVTDSTVTFISKSADSVKQYFGQIKASPNGTRIAAPGIVFNFDQKTGTVSTFKNLPLDDATHKYYGAAFSPNSYLLYYTTYENDKSVIYQYDLESSDSMLSRKKLPTEANYFFLTEIQQGPDNKLYVAKTDSDFLGVISSPDVKNTPGSNNCGFDPFGFKLKDGDGAGGRCESGLPNMVDAVAPQSVIPDFSMVDSACGYVRFYPNAACGNNFMWLFGDKDSSALSHPLHYYDSAATYTVTLKLDGVIVKTRQIKIGLDRPEIAGDSSVSCNTSDVSIYAVSNRNPECHYTWLPTGGTLHQTDGLFNGYIQWQGSGELILKAKNLANGCLTYDTLSIVPGSIRNNTITLDSGFCFPGSPFYFSGPVPEVNYIDTNIHFQWQIRYLSVWQNTSAADTLPYFQGVTGAEPEYFRRRAFNNFCEDISEPIFVIPQIKITSHTPSFSVCTGGAPFTTSFLLNISNGDSTWYPVDLYTEELKDFVVAFRLAGSNMIRNSASINHTYTYANRAFWVIHTPCGDYYSDTITIGDCGLDPLFFDTSQYLQLPSNQSVAHGDSFYLMAVHRRCMDNAEVPGSYSYWQESPNGSSGWTTMGPYNSDTLGLYADPCMNTTRYFRHVYYYPCTNVHIATPAYSVSFFRNFDLWARDSYADTGAEPNYLSSQDYWDSPDMWNNIYTTSYSPGHENPEYKASGSNRLHTRIRNKSMGESPEAKLYLYWTFASTGETWSKDWLLNLDSNGFRNTNSSSPYYDTLVPLGRQININPITIPRLRPGQDTILSFDWQPPNPAWYHGKVLGVSFNFDKVPFCFLGRIMTCDDYPYDMTYPEIQDNTTNVRDNNNIITKNTYLVDNIKQDTFPYTYHFPIRVGTQSNIRLRVKDVYSAGFTSYASLAITLDDALFLRWLLGGSVGTGFTLSGQTFRITNINTFYLGNFTAYTTGNTFATFSIKVDSLPTLFPLPFQFMVVQHQGSDENIQGAVHFPGILPQRLIHSGDGEYRSLDEPLFPEMESGQQSFVEFQPLQDSAQKQAGVHKENTEPVRVSAYPNPFSTKVNLAVDVPENAMIGFELYNAIGVQIAGIPATQYDRGKHLQSFDGSTLPPGVYFCRVTVNGQTKTLRLVLNK